MAPRQSIRLRKASTAIIPIMVIMQALIMLLWRVLTPVLLMPPAKVLDQGSIKRAT
ncbi:hypothetical protein [Paenibacillus sp. GCM10012306]|uniref:hypothetical protein n=1 Tax=Paenibacillus sp. GCM10012306 TaxID=3317342 RepID=UPI0036226725